MEIGNMTKQSTAWWEDYYAKAENFARCFADYAELKMLQRTHEQNVQFKAVTDVIAGKFTV